MKKAGYYFLVLLTLISTGILAPSSAMAISGSQLDMFAENDIYFYDPGEESCYGSGYGYGVYDGMVTVGLSASQSEFIDKWHDTAVNLSIEYGIPWEAVIAQGILESKSGTSNFAVQRNNFFGLGAVDSNPDNAYHFATPEDGWRGYYDFIKGNSTYAKHGAFSGESITNPYAYIESIKAAGYATDENYVSKLSSIIKSIEERSKDKGWESSAELAEIYPEMLTNAAENSQYHGGPSYTGVSGGNNGAGNSRCSNSLGMGLIDGGMTFEEAQAFMASYRDFASEYDKMDPSNPQKHANTSFQNAMISGTGCVDGSPNNCVAFSQWFINRYTSAGPSLTGLGNGQEVAVKLISRGLGFEDGGNTPRAYAIFSTTSGTAGYGHTGVVLGVDTEKGIVITGEASCGDMSPEKKRHTGFTATMPGARKRSLDDMTNGAYRYAYTDNILIGM